MPANGNRPTWRDDERASSLLTVSAAVLEHLKAQRRSGEAYDDTLRRLLSLAPRQRLERVK